MTGPRRPARPLLRHLAVAGALLAIAGCGDASTGRSGGEDRVQQEIPATGEAAAPAPPPVAPAPGAGAEGFARGVQGGAPALPAGAAAETEQTTAMIIRTGRALVEVDSVERAVEQVQALAQRVGGYVANTTLQAGDRQVRQAQLELKIPAARFQEALSGLRPLGEVRSVTVTSEDVGEEFVDVSARVANARRLEERLIALLASRTGRLEDVLAVERELARVREEIERYEGRLRYLRTRVATSTLTVTVAEPAPAVGDYPGANPIVEAFGKAWRNFVGFLAGFIAALGVLVPLGVIAFVFALLLRGAWRRLRGGTPPSRDTPPSASPGRTPPANRVE